MILFSNAKINIGLKILSKRADGFHNLQSIFYPIPLVDLLEIIPSKEFSFSSSGIPISDQSNSVIDAFELLNEKYNIGSVNIHLHKQIPLGSGLGGGSSNATHCIIGLAALFNLNLDLETILKLSLQLGSDNGFFVVNKPSIVTGRGEHISPIELDLSGKYIKLINNGTHVSTADAFRFMTPSNVKLPDNFLGEPQSFINDFESAAFKMHPELNKIKTNLIKEGAFYASMSGSGSTIYGLFDGKPERTGNYPFEEIFELE